jgi:phage-related protein
MPLPTFTPPIGPTPGTAHKPKVNLLKAEFGDGYSQSTPKGINHIRRTCSLKWDALTLDQMHELAEFFERMGGSQPFYYQPHGARSPVKWTCEDWSHPQAQDGVWTFTAELVQSFSNAA